MKMTEFREKGRRKIAKVKVMKVKRKPLRRSRSEMILTVMKTLMIKGPRKFPPGERSMVVKSGLTQFVTYVEKYSMVQL